MDKAENEIIVYQPNETMRLDVRVKDDMAWLNRHQLAMLFGRDVKTIGKHITNALKEELNPTIANFAQGDARVNQVVANFATTAADGKVYQVEYYSLEVVTSVGYRVKSPQGIIFRRWANEILKSYLQNGVAVRNKYAIASEMDRRFQEQGAQIVELRKDVDYFIRSSLPPKEKVFVDGQMLDAQVELTRIVKTAKKRIVLIDNYIDERTLMLLGSRGEKVGATVYTLKPNSPRLAPALANYAKEFSQKPIEVKGFSKAHDRFLIIDDTVWHVGASLKDAGSALFALMKMELKADVILNLL